MLFVSRGNHILRVNFDVMLFPLNRPARLAVFASGRGSNLDAILSNFPKGHSLASVSLVMSDNADAGALEKALTRGIPAYTFPFPARKKDKDGLGRKAFEREAEHYLEAEQIDLICLAGFMRLFSLEFNERWQGRLLNIHPSLLPEFKGLHPQRQALESKVSEAGCTVHFVDAGVDTGPIILQKRVPVFATDTEESLSVRILEQEHLAYPEAIRLVLEGKAKFEAVL